MSSDVTLRTDNAFVKQVYVSLRKDLARIIEHKGCGVRACGMKYYYRPVDLNRASANWSDRGMNSKPPRWLWRRKPVGLVPSETMGYFSLREPMMGYIARIVICDGAQPDRYAFDEHVEWLIIIVTARPTPLGSSSATASSTSLKDGIFELNSDGKKFRMPIAATAIIPPADKLADPRVLQKHRELMDYLEPLDPFVFDAWPGDVEARFFAAVDSIQVHVNADAANNVSNLYSEQSEATASEVAQSDQNTVLWRQGPDDLMDITAAISAKVERPVHIHCTANTTAADVTRKLAKETHDDVPLTVFLHHAESLRVDAVVAELMQEKAPEEAPATNNVRWIVLFSALSQEEYRIAARTLGKSFVWVACDPVLDPIEAVPAIYDSIGVEQGAMKWNTNLFVIAWMEMSQAISVSPEAMAGIISECLHKHPHAQWDVNANGEEKRTLLQTIDRQMAPVFLMEDKAVRRQIKNDVTGNIDVPLMASFSFLNY